MGPGWYATPAPPSSLPPSPNRHAICGTAVTVTASPASDTDKRSVAGAGSSQNHDGAPVRPALAGLVFNRPALSVSRSATCSAIVLGVSGGAAGAVLPLPVIVKHGRTESGAYWQTWPWLVLVPERARA